MGGRNIERRVVDAERVGLGVTYGPARDADGYVLTSITDGGRVELVLPEPAMYTLWTEVRNTPWPDYSVDDDRDVRLDHLVQLANDASDERLDEAVAVLRGERVAWDWSKRQPVTESQREVERAVADVEGD